ncbi:MAG: hypothetical protein ACOZNI_09150 [Myxococcota bacterium]
MLLSLALATGSSPALAAGFQAKTMRAPLSAAEVERPLVIGRGWLEFGLGVDYKLADGHWTDEGGLFTDPGALDRFESARWMYTTERLDVRYGIARRGELYWSVPFHYVRLTNEDLGTNISDFGIGDPRAGWKMEWLRTEAPTSSVITDLEFKLPAGIEAPGTYIGGPNTVTGFVMSTGTMDVALHVRGKRQFGPAAVTAGVGYVYRFSGVTQYCIETTEQQFVCRVKPGDEVRASLEPMVQLGPLALSAEGLVRIRSATKTGTTSGGFNPDAHLRPIDGTDGVNVDVVPRLTANLTRGFDLVGAVGIPIAGEDLLFPLEEVTPTYGYTYSLTAEIRY